MEIIELHTITDAQVADLLGLMRELNASLDVSADMLRAVASAPDSHLFAAVLDGRIVGTATLCVFYSPTGRKGKIEDVVVSSACRGMGLGRQLMAFAIEYARLNCAPMELALTSNPSREAANKLYQALGFHYYETNVYKLSI
jgi:GNAT superfamily N-acetyltransferase